MAAPDPLPELTGVACPVPPEQRPLQQYQELQASWFFVWPHNGDAGLAVPLLRSWLIVLPLTVLVAGQVEAFATDLAAARAVSGSDDPEQAALVLAASTVIASDAFVMVR